MIRRIKPYQPRIVAVDGLPVPMAGSFFDNGFSFLVIVLQAMFSSFTSQDQDSLKHYHKTVWKQGTTGTMCSGTDAVVHVEKAYTAALYEWSGINFLNEHLFACECDRRIAGFLMRHFPNLKRVFADICELADARAQCHLHQGEIDVVPVTATHKGFPCPDMIAAHHRRDYAVVTL